MNNDDPIFRSLNLIEERIREKLTVAMLAEDVHFSKYHYQRIFREAVGDSVMGYVNRRKIALAAEELSETDATILELALKYGYNSHEGFTRSFKTYMGVTPAEYRKYGLSLRLPHKDKENSIMLYSKNTDEIIREMNSLIVEAQETAVYIKKHQDSGETAVCYAPFWDFITGRTEKMAERLKGVMKRVTDIAQCPDEISARFLIIKGIEDAAFEASVTSFLTGLTIARAIPEHQKHFSQLCEKMDALAGHMRIRADKIAGLFNELSGLIFEDMKQNARTKLQKSVETGNAAADALSSPKLPYTYIADEIRVITNRLSSAAPEDITVNLLEDCLISLEAISLAAEADTFREPSHKSLFCGITYFQEQLAETMDFFRNLPESADVTLMESGSAPVKRKEKKLFSDLAVQEGILLFYLKGEIQKLGDTHLDTRQKESFKAICDKMDRAVKSASHMQEKTDQREISTLLQEAYDELTAEAAGLEMYGGPIRYLAEAIKAPIMRSFVSRACTAVPFQ